MSENNSSPSPVWLQNTSWRESGRSVKVGPLDGRLMIFIIIYFFKPSYFLLGLAVVAIIFFYTLDYMGYTLPNALRKFSVMMSGRKKNGVHYWRKKKF